MGAVVAVSLQPGHHFSKTPALSIRLLKGLGVDGDGHLGETVQHRSRVRSDPTQPNLRQVHLIHAELFDELGAKGFVVSRAISARTSPRPASICWRCRPARGCISAHTAVVEITGLRNPCVQIDGFQRGLMAATLDKDADGNLIRKAGIMSIVLNDGDVRPGDAIRVELPEGASRPLLPV